MAKKDKIIVKKNSNFVETDETILKLFKIIKSNSKKKKDGSYVIGKEITYYDDSHKISYKEQKIGATEYVYEDGCFYRKSDSGNLKKSKKAILVKYVLDSIKDKSRMSDFNDDGVLKVD